MPNRNAMKEILIISGFIMLVFAYRSFMEWHQQKDELDSPTQKKQDPLKIKN